MNLVSSKTIIGNIDKDDLVSKILQIKSFKIELEKMEIPFSLIKEAFGIASAPILYLSAGRLTKCNWRATLIYGLSYRTIYTVAEVSIRKTLNLFIETMIKSKLTSQLKSLADSANKKEIIELLAECLRMSNYSYVPKITAIAGVLFSVYAGKKISEYFGHKLTTWEIVKLELAALGVSLAGHVIFK